MSESINVKFKDNLKGVKAEDNEKSMMMPAPDDDVHQQRQPEA